jgi:hypothetical protein
MTDENYNGWKNYPTWAVNLWLSNDEGLYRATQDAVRDEYEDAPNCLNVTKSIWTVEEARQFNTADRLREMVEELAAEEYSKASFVSDLLGYALGEVDWNEIADAWIETA